MLLLGVGLRFFRLEQDSLWFDTAHSVVLASNQDLLQILRSSAQDFQSPLYFLLLHWWLLLAPSEFGLRLFSAFTGIALLALVYAVGRALFSPGVALLATAFTALSSYHIYFSQYPRSYMLLALFSLLSLYVLHRGLTKGGTWSWALLGISTALGLYTHPYALFLLGGQLLFVLGYGLLRERRVLGKGGIALLLAGLSFGPWLLLAWRQYFGDQEPLQWVPPLTWSSLLTLHDWLWFMTHLDFGYWGDQATHILSYMGDALLLLALVRREHRREKILLLAFSLLPMALVALVSLVDRPIWAPRFFVFAAPPFYLLLALAVAQLRLPWPRIAPAPHLGAVALWLFLSLPPLYGLYFQPDFLRPDIKGASAWVRSQFREGDVIVHLHYQGYLPSFWYNHLAGPALERAGGPVPCLWEFVPRSWCGQSPYPELWLDQRKDDLGRAAQGARRAWFLALYDHNDPGQPARVGGEMRALSGGYREERSLDFRGVVVRLMVAEGPASAGGLSGR